MIPRLLAGLLLILALTVAPAVAHANGDAEGAPSGAISVQDNAATDLAILNRISSILGQVDDFDRVDVQVDAGIVSLRGEVTEQSATERLKSLIARIDGVVAIQDNVLLSTDIGTRLESVRNRFAIRLNQVIAGLPFVALGLIVGAVIVLVGGWISRREKTMAHIAPNPFIAEFLSQTIRLTSWIVALVVALDLMEATTLLNTLLGAAGIFGLSLSFAARDTIEGFLATILLSLRQPFRPNDLIEVNGERGRVIRLTSRGTTLLTLDGNNIRFPNQVIYKAVLTNFTRNPERRFLVDLTVDPAADLGLARDLVLRELGRMSFVLSRPEPVAWVEPSGNEFIVIRAGGWVSQEGTDFDLARGEAYRKLRKSLDAEGFAIPAPVHRIHVENQPDRSSDKHDAAPSKRRERTPKLSPDAAFEQLVDRGRTDDGRDLLEPTRPKTPG